jgi:U3 small nucleolar RNA-associated protein 22
MFIHPTEDYDFVIQLDPAMLPRYYQNISVNLTLLSKWGDYANLRPQSSSSMRPGFDPAQLLFDDLKVGSLTLHLFPMLNALLSGYTPTH